MSTTVGLYLAQLFAALCACTASLQLQGFSGKHVSNNIEPVGVGSCSCRARHVAVWRIFISHIAQAVCSDFKLVGSHRIPTQSMEPAVVPLFGESVLKYMRGLDWKSRHEFYWWVALSPSKNSQFMAEYLREMLAGRVANWAQLQCQNFRLCHPEACRPP